MSRLAPPILAVLLLAACAHRAAPSAPAAPPAPAAAATDAPAREPLSGAALMKLIEDSPRTYTLTAVPRGATDPEKVLASLYPQQVPVHDNPRRVEENGRRFVRDWPVNPAAERLLATAEQAYQREEFEEAARLARPALEVAPDSYWTHLFLGDCAHFAGRPEEALEHYRRAEQLNPVDPRIHFFEASALVRLNRLEEARQKFARALALSPRRPGVMERIRKDARLDFTVADPFSPRVELEQTSPDAITVKVEEGAQHWLVYGLCKAAWRLEPSLRGTPEHRFSSEEERECGGLLVGAYLSSRQRNEVSVDDSLELLARAAREGQLSAWVVYELASRIAPEVTLTLPDDELDLVTTFVDRYVLVPR